MFLFGASRGEGQFSAPVGAFFGFRMWIARLIWMDLRILLSLRSCSVTPIQS
jgi:hypothetical protein